MKTWLTLEYRKLYLSYTHLVCCVPVTDETQMAQGRWSLVHIQNSLCEELLSPCMCKVGFGLEVEGQVSFLKLPFSLSGIIISNWTALNERFGVWKFAPPSLPENIADFPVWCQLGCLPSLCLRFTSLAWFTGDELVLSLEFPLSWVYTTFSNIWDIKNFIWQL